MKILTWTILKKTQIFNSCETFAFKYIKFEEILSICSQDIERKQNFGINQGPCLVQIWENDM